MDCKLDIDVDLDVEVELECNSNNENNPSFGSPWIPCTESGPALAMTYSPRQSWEPVFEAQEALIHGSIFPSLVKPFLRGACPND